MATQIFSAIGQTVYAGGIGGYKAFVDYGCAKYFMNTPVKTAALFGAVEGVATYLVVVPLRNYIRKLNKENDTEWSKFGKVVVTAAIFFGSLKVHQMALTFAKYPISYQTAATLGIINLTASFPLYLLHEFIINCG